MPIDETRLFSEFERLIGIPGASGAEDAVRAYLERRLTGLGFAVSRDKRGNLYGYLPGTREGEPSLFAAHMDTVALAAAPHWHKDEAGYRTDGTTALGADNRAGVSAILEALTAIRAQAIPHPPVEVLFTVEEERSLSGSRDADLTKIKAKRAYVPDSSRDVGTAIVKTPSKAQVNVTVTGKAAHAGLALTSGISAIRAAAIAVSRIPAPDRLDGATFNIGTFRAEGATNVVCDKALVVAEARSFDEDKLAALLASVRAAFETAAAETGAKADWTQKIDYRGYCLTAGEPALAGFRAACERAGVSYAEASSMGGSDANNLTEAGIRSVVMGVGAKNPHAVSETIAFESLRSAAALMQELMIGG